MPRYQRILLKLSGEVMAGDGSFGLDAARVKALAEEVAEVAKAGVQIGLVVGGGNFFRGVAAAALGGPSHIVSGIGGASIRPKY